MFTGNKIRLQEMTEKVPIEVIRDCEFSYAAKIPSRLDGRVVSCGSRTHINAALAESGIVGIITTSELAEIVPEEFGLAISESPYRSLVLVHETLCEMDNFLWEHFPTRVHPSASVHPSAVVAERDVVIGENTRIGPGSVILERSIIGPDCNIGVNVVVGLDALEIFEGTSPRRIMRQAGGVWLERGVTVLAKCTLVRATFGGFTRLGEGTILDVLIHLAHDSQLGKDVTLVACSEISGRCELGDRAYIGPNACLRNGIKVGADAKVSMGAVVTRDVAEGQMVSGNFAVEHEKWLTFIKGLK